MKHTKRLLATLLALVLALTLALPAMAAVNWNEFRITRQPQNLTITHGENIILNVEVNVPEGVVVAYQWRVNGVPIENATSAVLQLGPDSPRYPNYAGAIADFRVRITGYEKDNDGNIISSRTLESNFAIVTTTRTFWGRLYGVTLEPFVLAFTATFAQVVMTFGLLLPFSPLIFLGWLVFAFGQGIIGLFR